MKILAPALLAMGLLSACANDPSALANQAHAIAVLERHVEQAGGEATYRNLRNMRARARIVEPGYALEADYRATRDGMVRVDIYSDGMRIFSEGIDSKGPWQQAGEGEPLTGMSAEGVRRIRLGQAERFTSLAERARSNGRVRLLRDETIDGQAYHAIELTDEDDHVRTYLVSKKTGLVSIMREREALHPDSDATEKNEEEFLGDYREFCGQLHPTRVRTTDRDSGETLQETLLLEMECNLPDAELEISRPTAQA